MDVLSEVLRTVRLTGATFFSAEFRAPWGFTSPPMETLAPALESASRHVVLYHLITEGQATARLEGEPDVLLEAGDVMVFPHGHSHRVWHGRPRAWYDTGPDVRRALRGDLHVSRSGGAGALTRFVCGYFSCEKQAGPLFLAGHEAPMTYLARWRLQLAARHLETTHRSVLEVAGDVGYESEAAFNRAFRREFGLPPGQYRRNGRPASARPKA